MFEDIIREKEVDWNVPLKEMVKMHRDVIEIQKEKIISMAKELVVFNDVIYKKNEEINMLGKLISDQNDMLSKAKEEIETSKENINCAVKLLEEAKYEIASLRKTKLLEEAKEEILTKTKVKDMNGVEIKPSCLVFVHQEEETRKGVVIEVFPDRPTGNGAGFWVDINCGEGVEGMMSYILEVR